MKQDTAQTLTLTKEEVGEAQEITATLENVDPKDLHIVVSTADGQKIDVPAGMVRFLEAALRAAAAGRSITVASLPEELTSVEAARLLGMSRPTLLKMAKTGEIPSHKVGTHTRFASGDITRIIHERANRQTQSFNGLRDLEESLNLND